MSKNILLIVAVLGTGLIAGVFFAFSAFVMGALDKLPPAQGIAAMQSINVVVVNPIFMLVLFGTAILALYLGYGTYQNWPIQEAKFLLAASVLYTLAIAITMIFNVPLNDALAGVNPQSSQAANFWQEYLVSWTNYNHLRCLTSLAACGLYAWSLRIVI